jgi:hypothetical protein
MEMLQLPRFTASIAQLLCFVSKALQPGCAATILSKV